MKFFSNLYILVKKFEISRTRNRSNPQNIKKWKKILKTNDYEKCLVSYNRLFQEIFFFLVKIWSFFHVLRFRAVSSSQHFFTFIWKLRWIWLCSDTGSNLVLNWLKKIVYFVSSAEKRILTRERVARDTNNIFCSLYTES